MNLLLPFPPSANTCFPTSKHGGRHLSKKGRQFREEVYARVLEQQGVFKPFTGPVRIEVKLWPPCNRKRDLDNFAGKSLLDALTHANVWMDDSQIKESHNYLYEKRQGGKCVVVIEEMSNG